MSETLIGKRVQLRTCEGQFGHISWVWLDNDLYKILLDNGEMVIRKRCMFDVIEERRSSLTLSIRRITGLQRQSPGLPGLDAVQHTLEECQRLLKIAHRHLSSSNPDAAERLWLLEVEKLL